MAMPTITTNACLPKPTVPRQEEDCASLALMALAAAASDTREAKEAPVLRALHAQACAEQQHAHTLLSVRDFWGVAAAATSNAPTAPSQRPLPATPRPSPLPTPRPTACSSAATSTRPPTPRATSGAGVKKAKSYKWKGPILLNQQYVMQLPAALLPARPPSAATALPASAPAKRGKAKWKPMQQIVPGGRADSSRSVCSPPASPRSDCELV